MWPHQARQQEQHIGHYTIHCTIAHIIMIFILLFKIRAHHKPLIHTLTIIQFYNAAQLTDA